MKVLLIHPPISMTKPTLPYFNSLPLGLGFIAAVLEKNKIDVKILDGYVLGLDAQQLEKELDAYSPDIVGVSVVTPRAKQGLEIARIVKKKNPKTHVVLGGPHVSALGENVVIEDEVDIGVVGEGEATMLELVDVLGSGGDLSSVNGILYKENGEVKKTKPRELLKDLDQLPHPAYHMLPIDKGKYNPPGAWSRGRKGNYANMTTSRGCPHKCSYCDVHVTFGNNYRVHSPEYVVDELEYLYKKFNVSNFSFRDSIFTLNKKRIMRICELIEERGLSKKISWVCNGRVNYVDEELLKAMKSAGCWQVQYGVESGNQEILNKAARGTTIPQIKAAFAATKKAGLNVHGYFMVGLPGETKETVKDTVKLAKAISPDLIGFSVAIPFPGTEFYKWAVEHDHLKIEDWNSFVYNTAIVETPQMSISDVLKAQKWALRSYYLRPSVIFRRIMQIRSFNDLKTNLVYAKILLFSVKDIYRN